MLGKVLKAGFASCLASLLLAGAAHANCQAVLDQVQAAIDANNAQQDPNAQRQYSLSLGVTRRELGQLERRMEDCFDGSGVYFPLCQITDTRLSGGGISNSDVAFLEDLVGTAPGARQQIAEIEGLAADHTRLCQSALTSEGYRTNTQIIARLVEARRTRMQAVIDLADQAQGWLDRIDQVRPLWDMRGTYFQMSDQEAFTRARALISSGFAQLTLPPRSSEGEGASPRRFMASGSNQWESADGNTYARVLPEMRISYGFDFSEGRGRFEIDVPLDNVRIRPDTSHSPWSFYTFVSLTCRTNCITRTLDGEVERRNSMELRPDSVGETLKDLISLQRYLHHLRMQACEGGDAFMCRVSASNFLQGYLVAQDEPRGAQLNERSCNMGQLMGCHNFAANLINGRGVDPDPARGMRLQEIACAGDFAQSCVSLGIAYHDGETVEQDFAQALSYFERGCDVNSATSCHWAGYYRSEGVGMAVDRVAAAPYYQKACDLGAANACTYTIEENQ